MSFSRDLKEKASKVWEEGYNHPFVQELGKRQALQRNVWRRFFALFLLE